MIPRSPRPPQRRFCACKHGRITWEQRNARWLGTCSHADCGLIATGSGDGPEDPDGLRKFMLGDRPAQPYVPPWVRFFLRSSNAGAEWNSAGEPCPDCAGSLLVVIKLPWTPERAADPLSASLCLDDGSLSCTIWMAGEFTELHMSGEAWTSLPVQLQVLKRAISDRFPSSIADDDDPWNFQ